jgi:hypothetical protein
MTTKLEVRMNKYNDILTKNKYRLKAGQSMSRKDFTKLFEIPGVVHKGTYDKVQKANLNLVKAQSEINRLMSESGLYISSCDYYGKFYVRRKKETKNVVERMSSKVDTFDAKTERLLLAMEKRVAAGTWGTFNKVRKTSQVANQQPERHTKVLKRLVQV